MRFLLAILILLTPVLRGAEWFISQTGNLPGTNSLAWANTSSNWGQASIINGTWHIAAIGDSLTYGSCATGGENWLYYLTNDHSFTRGIVTNIAKAGNTIAQTWDQYTNSIRALGLTGNRLLTVWAGINDITDSTTLGQVTNYHAALTNIWKSARNDGWKVCAFTITDTSTVGATGSNRIDLLSLLISNSVVNGAADYLANVGTNDMTAFYCDQTHFTSAGYRVISTNVWNAINVSGGIAPGDTIRLVGTVTNTLTVQSNGTSANPITIAFTSGAKFSASYLPAGGSIIADNRSYIKILGGRFESTDNGTDLGFQQDACAVKAWGVSHLTISNCVVTNLYVHARNSITDENQFGTGFNLSGSDIQVLGCTLSDGYTLISDLFPAGVSSNITFFGNTLTRFNHGLKVATSADGAAVLNVNILSNRLDELDLWNKPGSAALHLDGIYFFNESAAIDGMWSNVVIAANSIGPAIGTNNTSAIFLLTYTNAQAANVRIFNNLLLADPGLSWNNGFINGDANVWNNSFINLGASTGNGLRMKYGSIICNNLFYNVGTAILWNAAGYSGTNGISSQTNVFYGLHNGQSFYVENAPMPYTALNGTYGTLAVWRTYTGLDLNSSVSQPSLDANYVPTSGDTVAKDAGIDLSYFFTTDKNGNTRSVPWTIGAFEYTGSEPGPLPLTNSFSAGAIKVGR